MRRRSGNGGTRAGMMNVSLSMPASLAQRTRWLSMRLVSSSAPGQADQAQVSDLRLQKTVLRVDGRHSYSSLIFLCQTISVQVLKCTSSFILSQIPSFRHQKLASNLHFLRLAQLFFLLCRTYSVSFLQKAYFYAQNTATHTSVYAEALHRCVCAFRKRAMPSQALTSPALPKGELFMSELTGQPRQPSVLPRGRCSPTSRPGPRGPCGRRRPACGRWACAGRDHG